MDLQSAIWEFALLSHLSWSASVLLHSGAHLPLVAFSSGCCSKVGSPNSHNKRTGSGNRSGHKRLIFRVTAYVFLHKRANRNDSQLVLARIFQCSMS